MLISGYSDAINLFKEAMRNRKEKDVDTKSTKDSVFKVEKEQDSQKIQARLSSIQAKLKLGKKLTASDLAFLREYAPMLYTKAILMQKSREVLRTRMENCKSKEAVQKEISNQLTSIRGAKDDIDMKVAVVKDESQKFMKTEAYTKLPSSEKKRKDEEKNESDMENRKGST